MSAIDKAALGQNFHEQIKKDADELGLYALTDDLLAGLIDKIKASSKLRLAVAEAKKKKVTVVSSDHFAVCGGAIFVNLAASPDDIANFLLA